MLEPENVALFVDWSLGPNAGHFSPTTPRTMPRLTVERTHMLMVRSLGQSLLQGDSPLDSNKQD